MHKTLNPPVDDLALQAANLPPDPRVLDAGCGLGGTVFRWYEKVGGTYEGITLSQVEVDMASREARRRGLSSQCRFFRRSYDEPPAGSYDAVVAIESLIHSENIFRTVEHLCGVLRPGGRLVMVDDVVRDGDNGVPGDTLDGLRKFWHLTAIPSEETVREAFSLNGLNLVEETDLTTRIQLDHSRYLSMKDVMIGMIQLVLPVGWVRGVGTAYRGGVALQRLYGEGKARYKMFVGEKGRRGDGEVGRLGD